MRGPRTAESKTGSLANDDCREGPPTADRPAPPAAAPTPEWEDWDAIAASFDEVRRRVRSDSERCTERSTTPTPHAGADRDPTGQRRRPPVPRLRRPRPRRRRGPRPLGGPPSSLPAQPPRRPSAQPPRCPAAPPPRRPASPALTPQPPFPTPHPTLEHAQRRPAPPSAPAASAFSPLCGVSRGQRDSGPRSRLWTTPRGSCPT